MRDRIAEFKRRKARVFVVAAYDAADVRRLLAKEGLKPADLGYPVLADAAWTTSATYGVAFQRRVRGRYFNRAAAFVVDRSGVLRYEHRAQHVEDRPTIDEVLRTIDELEEKHTLVEGLADKGPPLRGAAELVLKQPGPAALEAVPVLVKALRDADAATRAAAAAGLGLIAPSGEEAVPALAGALRDADGRVRRWAAEALRLTGPEAQPAVGALIGALADPDAAVRSHSALALQAVGAGAVRALVRALGDGRPAVRLAASRVLWRIEKDGVDVGLAVPALVALMKDNDRDVRVTAVVDVWRNLPPRHVRGATPFLLEALEDTEVAVRRDAAYVLGRLEPGALGEDVPRVVAELTARLKDPDEQVRLRAAESLKRYPGGAGR